MPLGDTPTRFDINILFTFWNKLIHNSLFEVILILARGGLKETAISYGG